jgi:hypothetical protein
MQRQFAWMVLLTAFILLVPLAPADDTTDSKAEAKAKNEAKEKLLKTGQPFRGKLVGVDEKKRNLTVEVTYKNPVPSPQEAQGLSNLQRQLADAQRNRNPADRARQVADITVKMEQQQGRLYKDATQKIEFEAPDEMKVRTKLLPVEIDDKGKPRKLTDKEKKALKGPDPKLPGYLAEFDSLKRDQMVEVYPVKTKAKPKTNASATDADKEKPKVAMIVILSDPPAK